MEPPSQTAYLLSAGAQTRTRLEHMSCSSFWSRPAIPGNRPVVAGLKYRNLYVGGSAQARRGILSLSYPIRQGIVYDWKDLETIWDHTFHHLLEVNPSEHAVIVSEAPKNPLRNRELMLEILFDKFGCQGAFVAIQAVLALYTGGRTTGIVLDSGDGVSHAVPVYEGYAIHHAISRLEYAGRALTDYLLALLTERGYYFTSTAEIEIVRDIKEKLCFISKDFVADMRACAKNPTSYDRTYELPDGQVLTVGSERFRCPEVLFRPSFLNLDGPGFQLFGQQASDVSGGQNLRQFEFQSAFPANKTVIPKAHTSSVQSYSLLQH
ncbi:Actin-6-like protein [Argiope bruennichi]|uniref:Actin-6-like protein n=1 Tax=Argiope bruennichi TaxID=94029 RepID=A0A8T0FW08_ARGBR|nr:Actin-6-like protein [Argiope bruennichi]